MIVCTIIVGLRDEAFNNHKPRQSKINQLQWKQDLFMSSNKSSYFNSVYFNNSSEFGL